ncbi:hypothetical protein AB1A65_03745 [Muricauda sp. ANG21]|uniref:hypothetical protein n=1 Tax=Allomuricauda sp. ANG21 TaxID=3042468 RepID=UPI003453A529
MKRKKIVAAIFGVMVLMFSCGVIDYEETGIIIINNSLENNVQMRFFRNGLPSGKEKISKTGEGEIFRGEDTSTVVLINQILQADSIIIIFDNERFETHLLDTVEPKEHSLFSNDSYDNDGNTGTYTIDAKNYNNATPCDGPCN